MSKQNNDHLPATVVLRVNPAKPEPERIEQAASVLRAGGLVAFPTETVYGLGANALDAQAVRGIFKAKARPAHDPLIVHIAASVALADVVNDVPPLAHTLAEHFWPGPLTLVLARSARIPSIVTAGGDTVAVRVPAHPVARALIEAARVPVAAPSANRFGHVSPTRSQHVLHDLNGRIDLILDGGPTEVGVESTVLTLVTTPPTILRPGGISREALVAVLGKVHLLKRPTAPKETAPSPGTLLQHYAPRAELTLYQGPPAATLAAMYQEACRLQAADEHVGLLLATEDVPIFSDMPIMMQVVGSQQDLGEVARYLFSALRALDKAGVNVILARDFGATGLGLAIRDRLTRAAGGRVIHIATEGTSTL